MLPVLNFAFLKCATQEKLLKKHGFSLCKLQLEGKCYKTCRDSYKTNENMQLLQRNFIHKVFSQFRNHANKFSPSKEVLSSLCPINSLYTAGKQKSNSLVTHFKQVKCYRIHL